MTAPLQWGNQVAKILNSLMVAFIFLMVGSVVDIPGEIGRRIATLEDGTHVIEIDWIATARLNWKAYTCYSVALLASGFSVVCVIAMIAKAPFVQAVWQAIKDKWSIFGKRFSRRRAK